MELLPLLEYINPQAEGIAYFQEHKGWDLKLILSPCLSYSGDHYTNIYVSSEPDVTEFLDDIVDWIRSTNRHMKPKHVMKKEDCMIVNFG